jgi:hypothetical protein
MSSNESLKKGVFVVIQDSFAPFTDNKKRKEWLQ